jgi:UV DNA damage endonuclease
MNIKPSLCCISLELQENGIRANTITKKRFLTLENQSRQTALSTISERVLNNINVVKETLKFCISKNWNYRISSNIFPLATLPEANLSYETLPNHDEIVATFNKCKEIISKSNVRCSTHPDQFVVPASYNDLVSKKSVVELCHHADFMDMLGLPQSYEAPINIHMNCYKGNLKEIANKFISVYNTLPHNVKSRLVLENEDKPNSWSVQELYDYVYVNTGIPITYDNLHFKCNPKNLSSDIAVKKCIETWGDFKPLFHFSDNDPNHKNPRAHCEYVREFPVEYVDQTLDIDFEFKAKDYAISKFEMDYM